MVVALNANFGGSEEVERRTIEEKGTREDEEKQR